MENGYMMVFLFSARRSISSVDGGLWNQSKESANRNQQPTSDGIKRLSRHAMTPPIKSPEQLLTLGEQKEMRSEEAQVGEFHCSHPPRNMGFFF